MHTSARRGHWLVLGTAGLGLTAALLLAAGWWLAAHAEAGWVWLGTPLTEQVAARLEPNNPASTDANYLSAAYQPATTVRGWHIVSVQAGNFYPLWQSLLDDDPTY